MNTSNRSILNTGAMDSAVSPVEEEAPHIAVKHAAGGDGRKTNHVPDHRRERALSKTSGSITRLTLVKEIAERRSQTKSLSVAQKPLWSATGLKDFRFPPAYSSRHDSNGLFQQEIKVRRRDACKASTNISANRR